MGGWHSLVDLRRLLPDCLAVGVALAIWCVFSPALMSPDSIMQYGEALYGPITDWHPPLMAIVLRLVQRAGGSLSLLMLGQCLAGVFGVRALAEAGLRLLWGERLSAGRVAWTSLLVLLLLLLPVSALPFYLMTFWKDAWALVLMLWIGALLIRPRLAGPAWHQLLLIIGLAAALAMVRYNAVVTLLFVGLALVAATPPPRGRRAFALFFAPLLFYVIGDWALERAFRVQESHVSSEIMVLDLVAVCARSQSACQQLPFTESHFRGQPALANYRPGDVDFPFWRAIPPVARSMMSNQPRLRAEYLRALRRFPGLIAKLKLEGFVSLLGLKQTHYFFHGWIVPNPHGLVLNTRFARTREWLGQRTAAVAAHPLGRWISAVHAVWLAANVLWVLALLRLSWRQRDPRFALLITVMLIPLSYYLSYLAASPVKDFRYMYPSTLFVQCVTLSALLGGIQVVTGRARW